MLESSAGSAGINNLPSTACLESAIPELECQLAIQSFTATSRGPSTMRRSHKMIMMLMAVVMAMILIIFIVVVVIIIIVIITPVLRGAPLARAELRVSFWVL